MRNIGGSIGIAAVTTLTARYQQVHINYLGAHVTPYNLQARNLLHDMSATMGGARQGYAAMFGMVQRQAAILSFLDVFRLLGGVFLALVPLVLIMKKPPQQRRGGVAH